MHAVQSAPLAAAFLFCAIAGAGEVQSEPPRAEGRSIEPVVASVNGEIVTLFDVEFKLGRAEQTVRGSEEEKLRKLEELRRRNVVEIVHDEILVQAAKRAGTRVTDQMVREELREKAKNAGGEASYYRLIRELGLTYAENWQLVERDIYIREFQRRLVTPRTRTQFLSPLNMEINVTPREMREYYRRNPSDFEVRVPGLFRLIRIRAEDAGSWKAALEKAEALRAAIAGSTDPAAAFALAAKENSSHETAAGGGAMPLTETPTLAPELHKILEPMAQGAVSQPVTTDFGIFLLFMERRISTELRPFDRVQREILDRLRTGKLYRFLKEEQERLLESARIAPAEIEAMITEGLR